MPVAQHRASELRQGVGHSGPASAVQLDASFGDEVVLVHVDSRRRHSDVRGELARPALRVDGERVVIVQLLHGEEKVLVHAREALGDRLLGMVEDQPGARHGMVVGEAHLAFTVRPGPATFRPGARRRRPRRLRRFMAVARVNMGGGGRA